MMKKLSLFVLAIAICNCPGLVKAAEVNQPSDKPSAFTHTQSPTGFIKGISWGWTGSKGQYLGEAPVESMKKLAETGANWVCIAFGGEMNEPNNPNNPHIVWSNNCPNMVTDDEIRRAVDIARKNNLKVILKPMVSVRDGTWRGYIDFRTADNKTDKDAWEKWWADFGQFLLYYARIARRPIAICSVWAAK